MRYIISLVLIFTCTGVYAQAVAQIRSHNQITGTGTVSHSILDTFYNSKGQAGGVASLDANGNVVQNAGTLTISGGYVKQTNGTATGTQLTSVQIDSGTATLSGIASPYIAQTNGTGSGITLSGTNIINGVTAPYIAQTNGTGSGITLSGTNVINGVTAPYIAQTNGTGTVSTITSTGNVNLIKDGQSRMIIKRSTIGSDALSLFMISVYGSDTTGAETNFANIEASIGSATDNQESGKIALWTMRDGFIDERLSITGTSAAFGGTGNKVDVDVYGTITARDGVKFPDNSTLLSGNIVKGIVAGSGISIDQSTGTVTITNIGSSTAGGWTDGTNTVYTTVAADQVVIGSTTAQAARILTVVGDAKLDGQTHIEGTLGIGSSYPLTGGNPTIELAIGDNDTGIGYVSDGIYSLIANSNTMMKLDGNTEKIAIGTTTFGTKLNVGGTVTAEGFSGNGAGLTSTSPAFSNVTGSATSAQMPADPVISGNLYVSGVVGGTTTGALVIPSGTTVQRPEMPTIGMMRYNTSPGTITGGIITVSGTYTIHTFNSSGTFTVGNPGLEYYTGSAWIPINRGTITTEVLVVGGGGGGAISTSGTGNGGGGAGGLISSSSYQVSGAVTVIIGAGGAATTKGNDSTFLTLVAVGGGRGGNGNNSPGNGGSGGGGDGGNTIVGSGTASQGNNGGAGAGSSPWESGGGGGSGAVGGTGTGTVCGSGGAGTTSAISGASVVYAGGGGGGVSYLATTAGSGGNGGGGAGGAGGTAGTNGTANSGGGGGGAGHASAVGGTGGSGIVIIRYITQ